MNIFKAYDIRGTYGDELTDSQAFLIGYYFGKMTKASLVQLGHDCRESSDSLTKWFCKGVLHAGKQVRYLGSCSTPMFYHALFGADSTGVMVTASHNPPEYNGFKIINEGKNFDESNGLSQLGVRVQKDSDEMMGKYYRHKEAYDAMSLESFLTEEGIRYSSPLPAYLTFLEERFDDLIGPDALYQLQRHPFVVDFSSGMSSLAVKPLLERKGLAMQAYNQQPDGRFPVHSPDPVHAKDFIHSLPQEHTAFGAAFDGDGDRVIFFDEHKELILPDYIIALLMDHFANEGHTRFVCDLRASRVLSELSEERDLQLALQRVGRSFYIEYMQQHEAVFGGELSGHLFFREFFGFDNPDLAFLYVIKLVGEAMAEDETQTISSLLNHYRRYAKLQECNLRVHDTDAVFSALRDRYGDALILELDGLSFDCGTYWFNVRRSNTEEKIRINLEAKNQDTAEQALQSVVRFIKSV